jgi:hypothetical protein
MKSRLDTLPVSWGDSAKVVADQTGLGPLERERFGAFVHVLWWLDRKGAEDSRTWEAAADFVVAGRLPRYVVTPNGRAALEADSSTDVDDLEACRYCNDTGFHIGGGGSSIRVASECNYCTSAERRERSRARGAQ